MTADEYDTGEVASPTVRPGAVGGGTGVAPRDGRIGDSADTYDGTPRTAVETLSDDTEERPYV